MHIGISQCAINSSSLRTDSLGLGLAKDVALSLATDYKCVSYFNNNKDRDIHPNNDNVSQNIKQHFML